jgi:superfamily II DNA or RNA helicase
MALDLKIRVSNTYSYLSLNPEISAKKEAFIRKSFQEICTGTYVHFYGKVHKEAITKEIPLYGDLKIPTGLLYSFTNYIALEIEYEINDLRIRHNDSPIPVSFPYEFDEKQKEAVKLALIQRRGYIKAATGAGKTSIMAALISTIGGPTLILERGIDLVEQVANDLSIFLQIDISKIIGKDSLVKNGTSDIVVASVDTLWANIDIILETEWLNQFHSVYGDEIHHATFTKEKITRQDSVIVKREPPNVTGYYKILMSCENAFNRFGFTATDEGSELYISATLGKKIIDIDEDFLISIGRLSKPYVILYKRTVPFYADQQEATVQNIYTDEKRNRVLIKAMETLRDMGYSSLFMIDSKKYQLEMIKNWTDFPVLTGGTKGKKRKEIYDQLRNKKIMGIILTVGKEGLNLPNVDCIIRASGKKSIRLVKQEKGRGSRITKTKSKYLIIDTFEDDGVQKFKCRGGAWRSKKGHLKKQSERRLAIYEKTKSAKIFQVESEEELLSTIRKIFNEK